MPSGSSLFAGLFVKSKTEDKSLQLSALSGEKKSFMEKVKGIQPVDLFDSLTTAHHSMSTTWHTAAHHQRTGGFSELLQLLKGNEHMRQAHWLQLLQHRDSNSDTVLHIFASHDSVRTSLSGDNSPANEQDTLLENSHIESEFVRILASIHQLRLLTSDDWYQLLTLKNNAHETVMHATIKSQVPAQQALTIFHLIGSQRVADMLIQTDREGYTVMDYIAQYCHDQSDLSDILNSIEPAQWNSIIKNQLKTSSCKSVLHQAAHWQHQEGFQLFLQKLSQDQRTVLFIKNEAGESVIDIATQFQTLSSFYEIAKLFNYNELIKIVRCYQAPISGRIPVDENDYCMDLQSMFKRTNVTLLILCLKYSQGSNTKTTKISQAINLAIHDLIDHPTERNKENLINLLHQKLSANLSICSCFSKVSHIERTLADLLETHCCIPQCYAMIACPPQIRSLTLI